MNDNNELVDCFYWRLKCRTFCVCQQKPWNLTRFIVIQNLKLIILENIGFWTYLITVLVTDDNANRRIKKNERFQIFLCISYLSNTSKVLLKSKVLEKLLDWKLTFTRSEVLRYLFCLRSKVMRDWELSLAKDRFWH